MNTRLKIACWFNVRPPLNVDVDYGFRRKLFVAIRQLSLNTDDSLQSSQRNTTGRRDKTNFRNENRIYGATKRF